MEVDCNLRVVSQGRSLKGSVVVSVRHMAVQITISKNCSLLVPEPLFATFETYSGVMCEILVAFSVREISLSKYASWCALPKET